MSTASEPPRKFLTKEGVFLGLVVAAVYAVISLLGGGNGDQRVLLACKTLLIFAWLGSSALVLQANWPKRTSWVLGIALKVALMVLIGAFGTVAWFKWIEKPDIRKMANFLADLEFCRNDYILNNKEIDADVLSRAKSPPAEWCNKIYAREGRSDKFTTTVPSLPSPATPAVIAEVPTAPRQTPSKKHAPSNSTNENANPQSISPQPIITLARDRAFVGVAGMTLHTDPMETKALITVKNYSDVPTAGDTVVLAGIIPSILLPDSVSEDKLFDYRPEWQHSGGFPPVLGPGDIWNVKANYGSSLTPDEWADINSGRKVIYVVTETDSGDRLGRLPPVRSCWYVRAPDWVNFHLCFGHNGFAAKARLGGGLNK